MADKAQSWVYAEDYIAENEILLEARDAANELGANPVSPGTGAALRMLAALTGARAVLEVGTGAGVSSLWLLDGMSPNGVLTTIDSEVEFHKQEPCSTAPESAPNVSAPFLVVRSTFCPA